MVGEKEAREPRWWGWVGWAGGGARTERGTWKPCRRRWRDVVAMVGLAVGVVVMLCLLEGGRGRGGAQHCCYDDQGRQGGHVLLDAFLSYVCV